MMNLTDEGGADNKGSNPLEYQQRHRKSSAHSSKHRKIVDINSLQELNFQNFLYSDMNKLNAVILSVQNKFFGQSDYVVEIKISNIPPFKVNKQFNEFKAFYNALKMRFENVKWPEFPNKFQLMNKKETRKNAFNALLQKIVELVRLKNSGQKSLLGIFYAFFLDTETIKKFKQEASKKDQNKKKSGKDDDGEEDEEAAKRLEEMLEKSVSQFEQKTEGDEDGEFDTRENRSVTDPDQDTDEKLARRNAKNLTTKSVKASMADSFTNGGSAPSDQTKSLIENYSGSLLGESPENGEGARLRQGTEGSKADMDDVIQEVLMSNDKDVQEIQTSKMEESKIESVKVDEFNQEVDPAFANLIVKAKQIVFDGDDDDIDEKPKNDVEFLNSLLDQMTSEEVEQFMKDLENDNVEEEVEEGSKSSSNQNEMTQTPNENQPEESQPQSKEQTPYTTPQKTKKASKWKQKLKNMWKKQSAESKKSNKDRSTSDGNVKLAAPSTVMNRSTIGVANTNPEQNIVDNAQFKNADVSKIMGKEIPNFSGILYVKLQTHKKWLKYFAKIVDQCLHLHKSELHNDPIHIIGAYLINVSEIVSDGIDYFEISHFYDNEKLQVCIDPYGGPQYDMTNVSKNLKVWAFQIELASQKSVGLNLKEIKYEPIGKCQLFVLDIVDLRGLSNNATCYVKITHIPYVLKTSKQTKRDSIEWKQSFFLPFCDPFFNIQIDVISCYNDGWVREHQKEEIICSGEIWPNDIIPLPKGHPSTKNLRMRYTDSKRKAVAKSLNMSEQDLADPVLKLKVQNLSSFKSFFAPSVKDHMEGIKLDPETYQRQYFKLGFRRVYRVISQIRIISNYISEIFHFKYPIFSTLCMIFWIYLIWIISVDTLFADVLLFMVLYSIYMNPKIKSYIEPFLANHLFDQSHINHYYKKPRVIMTTDTEIKKYMNTEKWREKLKSEDSYVTQFKKAKKSLALMIIVLNSVSSFFEKFKNIMTWEDPTRTAFFLGFSMFMYCALHTVGFRVVFIAGIAANFIKGIGYYKYLYPRNRQIAETTLMFITRKYFPEYNYNMKNSQAPWLHTVNFNSFQKKIVEQFKTRLAIVLPNDALLIYKTPVELVDAVSTCPKQLKFKKDPSEESLPEPKNRKVPVFGPGSVFNFILNVPSDYFRVLHPKAIQAD